MGDVRLQVLGDKFPLDISKGQSLEVLANQSKVTAKEKAALSLFVAEGDRCAELGADWRQQNYPASINGLLNTYYASMKSAIADLYAGKLSFGDMAKVRAKEYAEFQNKLAAEIRTVQAQRVNVEQQRALTEKQAEEQRIAEEQARQKAEKVVNEQAAQRRDEQRRREQEQADNQRRYEQQQTARADEALRLRLQQLDEERQRNYEQYMRTFTRPRSTTNCSVFGNTLNCTTR